MNGEGRVTMMRSNKVLKRGKEKKLIKTKDKAAWEMEKRGGMEEKEQVE